MGKLSVQKIDKSGRRLAFLRLRRRPGRLRFFRRRRTCRRRFYFLLGSMRFRGGTSRLFRPGKVDEGQPVSRGFSRREPGHQRGSRLVEDDYGNRKQYAFPGRHRERIRLLVEAKVGISFQRIGKGKLKVNREGDPQSDRQKTPGNPLSLHMNYFFCPVPVSHRAVDKPAGCWYFVTCKARPLIGLLSFLLRGLHAFL